MDTILTYIAILENGNYYVGQTKDPLVLVNLSFKSQWTALHRPIMLRDVLISSEKSEVCIRTLLTLLLMRDHGIDKVRGGGYCSPVLSDVDLREINRYLSRFTPSTSRDEAGKIMLKVNRIKSKIWSICKSHSLKWEDLINKFDEFESNPNFLDHKPTDIFTRSKKRSLFEDVDFQCRDVCGKRKRK